MARWTRTHAVSSSKSKGPAGALANRASSDRSAEGHVLETLEQRMLMSATAFSAEEVYLVELMNRARQNPMAEGARLSVNLAAGLTAAQAALLSTAKEPLVLDSSLATAARAHSLDMATRRFFDHFNPENLNPTLRSRNAGYSGTAGENIAVGYGSIDSLYTYWMVDAPYRRNVLSLQTTFDSTFHYDDIGIGIVRNVAGAQYTSYFTADFGNPTTNARGPRLAIIVMNDRDNDGLLDPGDGLSGIRVEIQQGSTSESVSAGTTLTTDATGYLARAMTPGGYTLRFTDPATGATATRSVTLTDSNQRIAVRSSDLVIPPPPPPPPIPDDFTDAGDWLNASSISVSQPPGDGSQTGELESSGDSDLFRFVAGATGFTTLSVTPGELGINMQLRVFSSVRAAMGNGAPTASASDSAIELSLVEGQTYFLLVEARSGGASTGQYELRIAGPAPTTGGGDNTGGDDNGGGGNTGGSDNTGGGDNGGGDNTGGDDQTGGDDNTGDDQPDPDPDPDPALLAASLAPGRSVSTLHLGGGRVALAFLSADLRPTFALRDAQGNWSSEDLFDSVGGPRITGDLVTWIDPKDRLVYLAAPSQSGLVVYKRSVADSLATSTSSWSMRNLSAEIVVSSPITRGLSVVIDQQGLVQLAGFTERNELVTFWQTGRMLPAGWRFFFTNITTRDLARQSRAMPEIDGALTTWVTNKNSLQIGAVDRSGNVVLFFRPGGAGATRLWNVTNLTQLSSAQPVVGAITVFQTPTGIINISGVTSAGSVSNITFRAGEGWRSREFALAGGVALAQGSLTSASTRGSTGLLAGLSTYGQAVLFRFDIASGQQRWTDTTATISIDKPVLTGALRSTTLGTGRAADDVMIFGTDEDGRLFSLDRVGSTWTSTDLTARLMA
jgi:uncharacterized protein YkwD